MIDCATVIATIIVQCATFSKSLNPRNSYKTVSDIRIRIRFLFESSFWISVSSCKLTILPDIQPANRIVIISAPHLGLALGPAPARAGPASGVTDGGKGGESSPRQAKYKNWPPFS